MIRIRRSFLEDFRRVLETPYGDEAALVRAIKGQPDPVSWQADAGTAWHAILSDAPGVNDDCLERGDVGFGDYWFSAEDANEASDYVGPGLTEVPGQWMTACVWNLPLRWLREPVVITGTADHIHGLKLQDHKCKFTPCNAQDYEQALQWRFYLLIHQCSVFQYNLFSFSDPKDGYCRLKDVISFRFFPYAGMEGECRDWVRRFVEWAGDKGLFPYLEV